MMILLTGGSGCGKSSFAERLCMEMPLPRYYIAAMKPYGEGGMEKVSHTVDHLESLMAAKYWPYPTFSDILFSV